jgi:cell division protein FtsQ
VRDLKSPKPKKVKGNRRKREKRPRDWKKIFHVGLQISLLTGSLALLAVGCFLGMKLVSDSGYFRIDSIRVQNQSRVSESEILALSDIRKGTNIFDLDLDMIGKKIEENPWIATARVERVFPREVIIQVTERVPKAVVNLGYLYYVDGSGEIFKLLDPGDSLDFPVITGIDRNFLLEKPKEGRRLLRVAMDLLGQIGQRKVFTLKNVSELNIDPTGEITLYTLDGGVPVQMGYGDFEEKLNRLERIYPQIASRLPVLKYIDLNVMDRVIVKIDAQGAQARG